MPPSLSASRLALRPAVAVAVALALGLAGAVTAFGQAAAPAAPAAAAPASADAPPPAAAADWALPARELRKQQAASLRDWAPLPNEPGKYQVPVDVMIARAAADPTLLAPVQMILAPASTPEEAGAIVFAKLQPCYTCHAVEASDMAPKLGPRLHGRFGSVAKFTGGEAPFDEAYIAESIKNPLAKISEGFPPVMPPLPLTDQQIADVTAYIKSLK